MSKPVLILVALATGFSALAAETPSEPRLELIDLENRPIDPFEGSQAAVTVFVLARTDCPISNRYAPEVRRIHEKFRGRGVAFWLVYPDPGDDPGAIRRHLEAYDYGFPAARDPHHTLVARIGARVTPEAAVFARNATLVYAGRIDDRYLDFGKRRAAPTVRDLEEAIEATLVGSAVTRPRTRAVGCFIAPRD